MAIQPGPCGRRGVMQMASSRLKLDIGVEDGRPRIPFLQAGQPEQWRLQGWGVNRATGLVGPWKPAQAAAARPMPRSTAPAA